jgi:hypothetical protein
MNTILAVSLNWSVLIGVAGLVLGAAGLVYADQTRRQNRKLIRLRKQQLLTALDLLRNLVLDYTVIEEFFIPSLKLTSTSEVVTASLWQTHGQAATLYGVLVDEYLASVPIFTYDDLKGFCETRMVRSWWEENQWRKRIQPRPENRGLPVPDHFSPEGNSTSGFWDKKLEAARAARASGSLLRRAGTKA